jgi:hypothetical protein
MGRTLAFLLHPSAPIFVSRATMSLSKSQSVGRMRNQYCADATNLLKVILRLQRQRRGEKFLEHRTV